MERLKRTLRSREGASMLMALLFLLLAVSVSAVLLPAALSGRQQTADDAAWEQSYLTVSSAARLLRQEITAAELTIRDGAEGTEFTGRGDLCPLLERAVRWVRTYAAPFPEGVSGGEYHERLTVTAEGFEEVQVDFAMDPNYRITMELSQADGWRLSTEMDCVQQTGEGEAAPESGVVTQPGELLLRWGEEEP